jgi:glycosyltransferase involved in cell wall biosynthesis
MHVESNRVSVIHVVASVADEAAGPSYSVPRLCEALAASSVDVRLFSVGEAETANYNGYQHSRFFQDWRSLPLLSQLRASKSLKSALLSVGKANIIHSHGLWLMPNIYPAWVAQRQQLPFVVSPRGMLGQEALRFSRFRKLAFWYALQGSALRSATCFHATSEQEYRDVRAAGLHQPVAIVPNGIDLPPQGAIVKAADGPKTALFLGRIHPKKGIDTLVEVWSRLEDRFPDWHLKIVGPVANNDYAKKLQRVINAKGLARARLAGPLYGASKSEAYTAADLFILPTLDDNFAMTVAEALAHGTPVISTKGAPWQGLEEQDCGWWIDHGVPALTTTLDRAMSVDRQRLAEMGQAGRAWMERDFSWNSIARSTDSVYRWLAGSSERPSCVKTA